MSVTYSRVDYAYKDPITVQKQGQMEDNVLAVTRNRIVGFDVSSTGTSTVIIQPGECELDGEWLVMSATAQLTAENAAHWEEGSSQEGSSTAWYVVLYKTGTNNVDCQFRNSAPVYSDTTSGTANGVLQYDKTGVWFRYLCNVYNDDVSALYLFDTNGAQYTFRIVNNNTGTRVLNAGAQTTFTTIDLSGPLPPFGLNPTLQVALNGVSTFSYRHAGSGGDEGINLTEADGQWVLPNVMTTRDNKMEYKVNAGDATINIASYQMGNRL